ncbi:glycosyltransferase family A protein [Seonamhaeicola aphaedonensis]|uniref:Glycosyl transferase family 2 n=1 Tax=Seonamhaeicola aphaedonensis TaxID=1461338 RepID=A0A3D9HFU9_9FLAO|nr:glycosyltransferase family A protein [Seonamhaeicola aphaedonensis]RED48372.1 glycosyl transferase family 2 [Seonamhaeicola aphaedonensis]
MGFRSKISITNVKKFTALLKYAFNLKKNHALNKTVRHQIKNYKAIPIIIISFNQLYYLEKLITFLLNNGYANIVIIDNNSTYKPLLQYFKTIKDKVTIYRLKTNHGHLALWKNQTIFKAHCKGYYVVTDADVVPVTECPEDFMLHFRKLLNKAWDRTKVGFSLKLDDIPETNPSRSKIMNWESKYWTTKIHDVAFKAEIDTTFALYRPGYKYKLKDFTKAWRTDYPLQAIHGGWYIDIDNLTEEQEYYIKTANQSASWNINTKGELVNNIHKPLYKDE